MIGPIHPASSTKVTGGVVTIKKFAQIGSNTVVFPSLTIGEGSVIGACSLVTKSIGEWGVYYGVPVVKHKDRSKNLLSLV